MENDNERFARLCEQYYAEIAKERDRIGFVGHTTPKRYYGFQKNTIKVKRKAGDQARLIRNQEGFWVEVVKKTGKDYIVRVQNSLISNRFLYDDLLIVNRKYIF
jgi:hypothetical protein